MTDSATAAPRYFPITLRLDDARVVVVGGGIIGVMTVNAEVRATAVAYLPWAAISPVLGVICFQFDGIFTGAMATRDMRNMMIVALAGYLATLAALVPSFGNHGLWIALNVFLGLRGVLLLARLKLKTDQTFTDSQ